MEEDSDFDDDISFAFKLQSEFDLEAAVALSKSSQPESLLVPWPIPASAKKKRTLKSIEGSAKKKGSLKRIEEKYNVVDPSWEVIDPTPDIHKLFAQFNKTFFWGELDVCEIKWSAQLTSSAGNCGYNKQNGACLIKLSSPLLRFRPRRDLVETLLHEMIHAYLFITNNTKDHSDHGPEFVKHMERLNRRTGAHITIYHNFHDEVDLYRVHRWQCNGPCKERRPFFGLVKSARNRTPGPSYIWWDAHQASCTGTFSKIMGPEIQGASSKILNYGETRGEIVNPMLTPYKIGNPKLTPRKKGGGLPLSSIVPFSSQEHVLSGSLKNPTTLASIENQVWPNRTPVKGDVTNVKTDSNSPIERHVWMGLKSKTPAAAKGAGGSRASGKTDPSGKRTKQGDKTNVPPQVSNETSPKHVWQGLKSRTPKIVGSKIIDVTGLTQSRLDTFLRSPNNRKLSVTTTPGAKSSGNTRQKMSAEKLELRKYLLQSSSDDDGDVFDHRPITGSAKWTSPTGKMFEPPKCTDTASKGQPGKLPSNSPIPTFHLLTTSAFSDGEQPTCCISTKKQLIELELPKPYSAIVLPYEENIGQLPLTDKEQSAREMPGSTLIGKVTIPDNGYLSTAPKLHPSRCGGDDNRNPGTSPSIQLPISSYSATRKLPSPSFFTIDSSDDEVIPPSPKAKRALTYQRQRSKHRGDGQPGVGNDREVVKKTSDFTVGPTASVTNLSNAPLHDDDDSRECPNCDIKVALASINQNFDRCLKF